MTTIRASSTTHAPAKGQCRWHYTYRATPNVYLDCTDDALPLGSLCADCLLIWAAAQPAAYWIAKDRVDGVKR